MLFDYSRLKGRIKEKCDTQFNFARMMGLSNATMTAKMHGKSSFSQSEIVKAAEILDINPSDVPSYFFCPLGLDCLNQSTHERS